MIDDPEPEPDPRLRRRPSDVVRPPTAPHVPVPHPPPPLDDWDLDGPGLDGPGLDGPGLDGSGSGWGAVAADVTPPAGRTADRVPAPRSGGPADARPLLVRVLRPWFEPRPGELRGAIVLLTVALAASLALWFDATRRPVVPPVAPVPAALAPADAPPPTPPAGRADGSDGWGLGEAEAQGPVVHVSGAVLRPGVVTLPVRSRVADAIDAVGGAMPDARLDRLNLARVVEDGERVHVPRVGEDAPPPDEPASRGVLPDGRIDLNAASQAELETLPGVGPARAQAIIAEREARPFRVPGDLRRVPGIGEATFQRLAPLVAVR
jgi:competence protein ComEA